MLGEAELFPAFLVGDRVRFRNNAWDTFDCICERGVIVEVVPQASGGNGYRVTWDANHGRWNGLHSAKLLRLLERG